MPRGRPKLIEYKNVTENEKMLLEVYSDEPVKHLITLQPKQTIYLSQKDIRFHKNDTRFLEGRIVPVGSEADMVSTRDVSDVMSDEQIHYFIRNTSDVIVLKEKIRDLTNLLTVERLLKEAKLPENEKAYAFVMTIEEKFNELVKLRDAVYFAKNSKEKTNE